MGTKTIIGAFFIGVILIAAIVTILTDDPTLHENKTSERINASVNDTIAYFGKDTPAGSKYSFAVEVDQKVYYIPDDLAENFAGYSPIFRYVYQYDLNKYSNTLTPDALSFGRGGIQTFYVINDEEDHEEFQFPSDRNFSFEYETGKTVGMNKNASVMTKMYYPNGTEIVRRK